MPEHFESTTQFSGELSDALTDGKTLYSLVSSGGAESLVEHKYCLLQLVASILGIVAVMLKGGVNIFGAEPCKCETVEDCCAELEKHGFGTDAASISPAVLLVLLQLVKLILPKLV